MEELTRRWQLEDGEEEEPEEEKPAPEKDEEPKLLEKFLKTRTILISEEITSELAKRVYQNLLLLEADDAEKPITVVINSPGGEADSGFGIYDMMRFVRPPVRTIVAGLCASAAILIFLAAKKEATAEPSPLAVPPPPALVGQFRPGVGPGDRGERDHPAPGSLQRDRERGDRQAGRHRRPGRGPGLLDGGSSGGCVRAGGSGHHAAGRDLGAGSARRSRGRSDIPGFFMSWS